MLKADRVASDCQDMEKVYVSSSEELVEISRINANCKLKEENNEENDREWVNEITVFLKFGDSPLLSTVKGNWSQIPDMASIFINNLYLWKYGRLRGRCKFVETETSRQEISAQRILSSKLRNGIDYFIIKTIEILSVFRFVIVFNLPPVFRFLPKLKSKD